MTTKSTFQNAPESTIEASGGVRRPPILPCWLKTTFFYSLVRAMRKLIVPLICVLAATGAFAEERVAVDFSCLSGGAKNSIHLEWRTFIDVPTKWIASYVRYKNSATPISLVLKYEEVTQKPAGRPWELTEVWLEVVDGKITGEYEVVSQGARINSFSYKNYRTGKAVDFGQDDGAYEEGGCQWR